MSDLTDAERTSLLHAMCIKDEHDDGVHPDPSHCAFLAEPPFELIEEIVTARLVALTGPPALDAFRQGWAEADAEGREGRRVLAGMIAAIKEVS